MSLPNRPAYQKPTKSSACSSSNSSSGPGGGGGAAPGARWNGNYSAGVSPVRGLSPVRGNFHGVAARQDMEMARSHTNPLFNSRTSDTGRGGVHTTPTKACKECKENREKVQEPWKVPTDKAQYSGKTLNSSTPTGKSTRTIANMRFTTPPKPVVKRKILAENREFITTTCPPTRMKEEEIKPQVVAIAATAPPPPSARIEVIAGAEPTIVGPVSQSRNDEGHSRAESDGLSSAALSPEWSTTTGGGDSSKPKSPLVSIEELQKRIQKFLQDEGGTSAGTSASAADVSVPIKLCTPRQSTESLRMSLSGTSFAAACGEESSSSLTGVVDEAPFQPVVAPYSPRPEFLRARKSPSMDGTVVSPLRGEADILIQEKTTTTPSSTYDPKNNFLSPRPQFLRYRPLRRLELLRKSAEGTLGDLDLESPATDADSSRMSSEKDVDEKEVDESESQDVSQQEAQSLNSSSSLESPPPRCKVSSHELFKSAAAEEEENVEIIQLRTAEEPQQKLQSSISSTKPPPDANAAAGSGFEVPSTDSEFDRLEEEDAEDSDNSSASAWYYHVCGIVTVTSFVALLVVASGSSALLPTALHQNYISHLWKTSRSAEPIRLFLQTTEGLWAENSHVRRDFSLSSPDIVRVGWVHVSSLIQSHVDLSKVVKIGKVVWSSCMDYSARFGRLIKESYAQVKASLEGEMDYSSRSGQEEVNEWGWVPDYEFVVPNDIFDPVQAYETIMARMESWEVKSFWASLVKSYARHPSSKRIVEEPLDSSIEGRNASLCSICSAKPAEDDVILSFRLPAAALGRVVAETPISKPSEEIEINSNMLEESKEENTAQQLDAQLSAQNDYHEFEVGDVATELSSTPDASIAAEHTAGAIVEDESFSSPPEGEIPFFHGMVGVELSHDACIEAENTAGAIVEDGSFSSSPEGGISLSHGVEGVELSHGAAEKVQLAARVAEDETQLLRPVWSQEDQPVPFQESLQGDSGAEVVPVTSSPEENDVDSSMALASKPVTLPRSLFLEELIMHAPCFRTTAAIFTSLLLAAGVALLVFHKMYTRSGSTRTATNVNLKASEAEQRFSKSSVEPQFNEANEFYPIEGSPGSEVPFLAEDPSLTEDPSLAVHLSFHQVRQFSTPYHVTGGTPDRLLGKGIGKDALEKSLKHVTDFGDTFQTPDMEAPEKSSLGLFTTVVPVVLNEGTARERVQLTPVRRSSRIRTRMQNSPCHLMHSPHFCNC